MSWLTTVKEGNTERAPAGFEDKLVWLCRFGTPGISKHERGWHAQISMNTNTTGSEFKVRTGFDCQSPSVAVDSLIERMLEALAALGVRA